MESSTVYYVYQTCSGSTPHFEVGEKTVQSYEEAITFGRVVATAIDRGKNVVLADSELQAYKTAYKMNLEVMTAAAEIKQPVGECPTEACPGDCQDCQEDQTEEYFSREDLEQEILYWYPCKLVRFPSTRTIRLFSHRPDQHQSKNCAFISAAEAEQFKKDSNIKALYALTRKGNTEKYEQWSELIDQRVAELSEEGIC